LASSGCEKECYECWGAAIGLKTIIQAYIHKQGQGLMPFFVVVPAFTQWGKHINYPDLLIHSLVVSIIYTLTDTRKILLVLLTLRNIELSFSSRWHCSILLHISCRDFTKAVSALHERK